MVAARSEPSQEEIRAARRESRLRERYGLLLASLVVLFIVQGVAPGGPWQEVLITALSASTLVLALRAGEVSLRIVRLAVVAGAILVATVAALALADTTNTGAARIASGLLVAVAPPAIAIGVLRGLRARGHTTVQAVLGVLCLYLMFGLFCAFAYGTIDHLGGAPVFANDVAATTAHCLYFSFATLTTVGYGDVLTRSDLGHTFAVTEALVGQVYLVTVVALLVSDLGSRRTHAP
ncbi:potassium channel family protein [Solirubrobacter ginsenosidimutans]|uniref:Potassium channel family protein n=1 Tax=Solirubrobacter ginsenosidimutans TaxID=490573 RepID=A0A9X3RZX0_9ACTN|nr:potassium channel family protein [Solirubrobacter ginsenosidimutans]MDA0161385.1 potassium channel family protein [Solirubrobacter ginsenosidimutans]